MYIIKSLLWYQFILSFEVLCSHEIKEIIIQSNTHKTPYNYRGLASGTYLAYIAQTSAEQAKLAIQNQEIVANQAAFGATSYLARTATDAAATAKAILLSKQICVQDLKEQLEKAHDELQYKITQYKQFHLTATTVKENAIQAHKEVETLAAIVQLAKNTATHANLVAGTSAYACKTQQEKINKAKKFVKLLKQKILEAIAVLQVTERLSNKDAEKEEFAKATAAFERSNNSVESLKADASVMETLINNLVPVNGTEQLSNKTTEGAEFINATVTV